MKKTILTLLTVALLSGCSTRIADVTVVSTKNFNMNSGKLQSGKLVTGQDKVTVIIFPIRRADIKTAIDDAIEKDRCAVGLSDVVVNYDEYAFIFGYVGFTVKGNLILDKGLPGCGG